MTRDLDEIVARGRAMAEFCERVRARGDRASVEETEDLPVLRALYRIAVTAALARIAKAGELAARPTKQLALEVRENGRR